MHGNDLYVQFSVVPDCLLATLFPRAVFPESQKGVPVCFSVSALSLPCSVSLPLSLFPSLSLSPSLSLFVSISLFLSLSLSPSPSLSLSHSLCRESEFGQGSKWDFSHIVTSCRSRIPAEFMKRLGRFLLLRKICGLLSLPSVNKWSCLFLIFLPPLASFPVSTTPPSPHCPQFFFWVAYILSLSCESHF